MTSITRRTFVGTAAASAAVAAAAAPGDPQHGTRKLKSLTAAAEPISAAEHGARIAKLQSLMQEHKTAALLVEAGSSLEYFTGIRWWRSERTTAAVIPATGRPVVVTPFFEEPSIRETLEVAADVRPWKEDEDPFALLAAAVREQAAGALAVEPTTRFFIVDRVTRASGGREVTAGAELVRACRLVKSPAELSLMQAANDVTLAALRHVHGAVAAGMHTADLVKLMTVTTEALGGTNEFVLVLMNEASAFPHGSIKPQTVREGSVILMDCGCSVHGYQSDISRTWVFGAASARQRQVWATVKRGQEIALEAAKPGVPVGSIDQAVRTFYEQQGWSRDYGLPGLSHRTGHGIGLEGHEPPYLVRNDTTALAAGMCFSDEPGLYIPGEFGIRLEDCWHMTETGPRLFTRLARSLEQPV